MQQINVKKDGDHFEKKFGQPRSRWEWPAGTRLSSRPTHFPFRVYLKNKTRTPFNLHFFFLCFIYLPYEFIIHAIFVKTKEILFLRIFFYSFNPGLYHTLQIHGKARSLPRPSPTLFFSVFLSVLIYLVLKNMEFFTNVSVGLNGILFFFF